MNADRKPRPTPLAHTEPKRLLILGATGGTGRHLTDLALDAGHAVTILARDPSRVHTAHPRLTVASGDAADRARLAEVVPGHDAVLFVVGAPGRDRSRIRARSTAALVAVMEEAGVRRLIALSSYGVGETRPFLPWYLRYAIVPVLLAGAFADHEEQEGLVRASALDWTLVRPPHLNDGQARGELRVGFDPSDRSVSLHVARADVAAFLLSQVHDRRWLRKAAAIA